jgi:gas vesicle protein
MRDTRAGDRATFFLLGAAIGATTALLMAPPSGARTRRRLVRKGEEVAGDLIDAGNELIEKVRGSLRAQRGTGGGCDPRAFRKVSRVA